METPLVSHIVNMVKALTSEEAISLWGVKGQVEQLGIELTRMQCFLEDLSGVQSGGAMSQNWVVEATDLANESQDIIDAFLLEAKPRREGGVGPNLERCACIFSELYLVLKVWLQIKTVNRKIKNFNEGLKVYGIRPIGESSSSSASKSEPDWRRTYHHLKEYTTAGLEKDAEVVAKKLVQDDKCRVVSIYGLGGLGKTTLARKVFHHREVKSHFVRMAWACISQQYNRRDILHGILTKIAPEMKETVEGMRDDELLEKLYQVQRERKCLVVLDDIWSFNAWSSFENAFPITENISTGSKILITTRSQELGPRIHPNCFPFQPRYLDKEESWNLLKSKAVGTAADGTDLNISPEMEAEGRKMAEKCKGLPLAIIVLGGLLANKRTLTGWQEAYKRMKSQMRGKDDEQEDQISKVLALSYHDLPYKYRPCFLYLSIFPEDYSIHTKTLYRLWIAEEIVEKDDDIVEKEEDEIMMDVAERYLDELVRRCIVQVEEVSFSGKFKYCRIHDVMRDFCLREAKRHHFLRVIHPQDVTTVQVDCSSISSTKIRRLAIHSSRSVDKIEHLLAIHSSRSVDKIEHLQSETSHYLRSILLISPHIYCIRIELDWNFKNFKLLKTLQLENCSFLRQKSVESIGKLVRLRYLSFRNCGFVEWTTFLYKLNNLQTLEMYTRGGTFQKKKKKDMGGGDGPIGFENMGQLRHLSIGNWSGHEIKLLGLTNLETLKGFTTRYMDINDLFQLKNLRRLVKAEIDLCEVDQGLVILETFVKYLSSSESHRLQKTSVQILFDDNCDEEWLGLLGQLFECARISKLELLFGGLSRLPEFNCSTSGLTCLDLQHTRFEEDPMPTLERLPKLQRLYIVGDYIHWSRTSHSSSPVIMTCSARGFPQLKTLEILDWNGLKEWRVDEGAMPNLSTLIINSCNDLEMFPGGLRSITTLEEISIGYMPETFTSGLRAVDFHSVPVISIIEPGGEWFNV